MARLLSAEMPAGHGTVPRTVPTAQECLFKEQQLQAASWWDFFFFKGMKKSEIAFVPSSAL